MPYAIEWGIDRVTVKFTGLVSTFDFLEGARIIGADPRFDELRFIVNDFRAAQLGDFNREEVLEGLIESAVGGAVSNPAIRVAVVAPHPEIVELAQAFRALLDGEGPMVAVFGDERQALEWMSVDPGQRRVRPRVEG